MAVACDGVGVVVVVVVVGSGVGRYAEVEAEVGGGGGGRWYWKGDGGGGGVESESDVPFNRYTVIVLPINAVLSPSVKLCPSRFCSASVQLGAGVQMDPR